MVAGSGVARTGTLFDGPVTELRELGCYRQAFRPYACIRGRGVAYVLVTSLRRDVAKSGNLFDLSAVGVGGLVIVRGIDKPVVPYT